MKKHLKIEEGFYLINQKIQNETEVEVSKNTNHIFVVDVSGSMYYDLPLIRKQLKNKLSNLMREGDTISIIWFSGRNDSGILKEEVEVKSLKTLTDLHDAIDRWLTPVGLTAFLKPLQLTKDMVQRIKQNRPDSVFSFIFLTDGYNNDCPWNEVISALKEMEEDITASTFVEYGYYADTQKLTQMAGVLGGEKISTSNFDEFEPIFDKKISNGLQGGKKIVVDIPDDYLYDFAFAVNSQGSVFLYNISDGKIMVSPDIKEINFFSNTPFGDRDYPNLSGSDDIEEKTDIVLYGAIYVLSDKLMNFEAEKIFYALGDNYHYKQLLNAFGKQKLNSFKNSIKDCITDTAKRFPNGRSAIQPVEDNAYCLMNLVDDLASDENCLFFPNHNDFEYNRIGRKRTARGEDLSTADKKRLSEAKSVDEANKILEELKEKNVDIKFVNTDKERGYSLRDLVWNSVRANLSVRIKIDGKAILPDNKFKINEVATYKYNTFTLVKDGIVNVEKIPVSYSTDLAEKLSINNIDFLVSGEYIVIDITSLPLINRAMVKEISANELAKLEWELLKLQAEKKVYDFYRKDLFPKTSENFAEMLGQECADWLKEVGVTDYNGFAPKTDAEEAKDFYMSVNLKTKIAGVSSLPKVLDVVKKIEENKSLKLNEWLLSEHIKNYQAQLESEMFKSLSEDQQKEILKTYLIKKTDELNVKKRGTMQKVAEIKFSLILSKRWFKEFTTFDENTLDVKLDEQDVKFTFDLSEKEQKI
jgi:von Willebrand factor type A domain